MVDGAPALDRTAVADLLGVSPGTVTQHLVDSKPGRRYADRPFPTPDGYFGRAPYWRLERKDEILAWAATRPGRGAGGGRPRRTQD